MPQGPSLHSRFKMSSNAPTETSSQMPEEPARNLPFQVSPPVTPTSPTQSSLSVPERDLHQQETQGPSRPSASMQIQAGPVMGASLPILRSLLLHPSHQIPSRSSARSGVQVPVGPMVLPPNYGDQQNRPAAPRNYRKMRTVYTNEQKSLLRKHFDECTYPNREKRKELASLIRVTENEIQVCLSSRALTATICNPPNQTPELCALKCLGLLWKVNIHASRAGPPILLQLWVEIWMNIIVMQGLRDLDLRAHSPIQDTLTESSLGFWCQVIYILSFFNPLGSYTFGPLCCGFM